MNFFLSSVFLAYISISTAKTVRYESHEVWRVYSHRYNLENLFMLPNIDVWKEGSSHVDIRVPPKLKDQIAGILQQKNVYRRVIIQDVQKLIDLQEADRLQRLNERAFGYDQYNNFTEIQDHLISINASNPQATLVSLGKSIEGRDIWQMKFSTGGDKPVVWFDCGIHSGEWISPATCLFGIGSFDRKESEFMALLDSYDVHIIPICNPDGYEWTWKEDRLWRKNRNTNSNVDGQCPGVDLNRNFDAYWGGLGTSNDTCSIKYCGIGPASEPEVQVLQNAILEDLPVFFIAIHAYSQLWMYPYSYDYVLPPENDLHEMDRVASVGVQALTATYGTEYQYGPISTTIYPAAGSSADFAYDHGVVYSFAMELRDTGEYGLLLPEDQIIPTATESWNGFIAAINALP